LKRFSRTKLSNCHSCPLRDGKRVWGEYPTESKPRIVLLGEAPGRDEDYEGRPFVGMAGRKLNWALYEAGIQRHQVGVSNVISCRPPGNDIGSNEGLEALECCKRGFLSELASWKKDGVRVVVPLGNTALRSLGIEETISKARGSVYVQDGLVILPTYHPSFINRGMQKEEPTWIADLEKALQLSKKKYQPPKENFTIFPSLKDIESFYRRVKETKGTVAVDIETTGLRPDVSDILVVGLASDGETAVSFPFFSSGLRRYWKPDEQKKAFNLLRKILSLPTMFQNALFDVPFLENNGFEVPNIVHDVLLLHHCIHPELPHRLDYIVSIYGTTPYWKGEMKRKEGFTSDVPDETLRTYNLRDAVVLHQVLPGLLEDAKEYKVLPTYEKVSVPLIRPIMSMTMNGLPLDTAKLESWKGELRRKHGRLEKELRDIANLPSEFNLSSGDHLRYLLYGLEPNQYTRCLDELSKYEIEGSRLKKNTKKYAALQGTVKAFAETTPFTLPKGYSRRKRTATGGLAVDEETMLNIQIAANNRLSLVRKFVNPKPEHEAEKAELSRLILWLSTFRSFQEVDKLLSTYTSFPTWRDGRVHPRYLIHGTATGRLSSREPNAQNIPPEARKVFVAPEGFLFLEADYSNLELRILSWESDDDVLQNTFAKGENAHDNNTKDLFGITPEDPLWKPARKASKIYIFGRNYGGGLKGIYKRVMQQVPELGLTFDQFVKADERYRSLHPKYTEWYLRTAGECRGSKRLVNSFGRHRIFLGTAAEVEREGLNFPIQSAAADIINRATIRIFGLLRSKRSRLIGQIHDALLLEVAVEELEEVKAMVRKEMERPLKAWGKTVSFPVEIKIGESWGSMKEVA
jgi:uracil-DNA glycosylase family 4